MMIYALVNKMNQKITRRIHLNPELIEWVNGNSWQKKEGLNRVLRFQTLLPIPSQTFPLSYSDPLLIAVFTAFSNENLQCSIVNFPAIGFFTKRIQLPP